MRSQLSARFTPWLVQNAPKSSGTLVGQSQVLSHLPPHTDPNCRSGEASQPLPPPQPHAAAARCPALLPSTPLDTTTRNPSLSVHSRGPHGSCAPALFAPARRFLATSAATATSPSPSLDSTAAAPTATATATAVHNSAPSPAGAPATSPSPSPTSAPATSPSPSSAPPLSFSDHRAVFEGQSSWQLLRAYVVLRTCGLEPVVRNAESLLARSRALLGAAATDAAVKASFFAHFCAGEDVGEVQQTVDRLRASGVGAILDYAAEDDVGPSATPHSPASASQPPRPAFSPSITPTSSSSSGDNLGSGTSSPPNGSGSISHTNPGAGFSAEGFDAAAAAAAATAAGSSGGGHGDHGDHGGNGGGRGWVGWRPPAGLETSFSEGGQQQQQQYAEAGPGAEAEAANISSSSSSSSSGGGGGSGRSSWAEVAAVAPEPSARALGVVGRTYDYASEEQCDRHVEHFLAAIEMAARQPGRPAFAAIKMTALGNPALLERASTALTTLQGLFARFDEDGSGFVDRGEFLRQWRRLVAGRGGSSSSGSAGQQQQQQHDPHAAADPHDADPHHSPHDEAEAAAVLRQAEDTFRWLDRGGTGKVDYVSWCQRLDLPHMPMLAARIAEGGGDRGTGASKAVADACLDGLEVELMGALLGRLRRLVSAALRHNVRLMIDAEHTYFQPAIEHVTLRLMREHNRDGLARVLNTYQAYLVDCPTRLHRDLERARREGWVLGAKLVRGAYLHLERRRASQLGYPSPCWGSLADTHACYDACAADLLQAAAEGRAQVLLGTHNQPSVEAAVARMGALGLQPPQQPQHPTHAPHAPVPGSSSSSSGSSSDSISGIAQQAAGSSSGSSGGGMGAAAGAGGSGSSSGGGSGGSSGGGVSRPPGVMFGQLLGMSDHLTLTLGKAGYRAYKYVPYGCVSQVMPYLLRRAAENQDILKGAKQDLRMLRAELRRRAAAAVGLSS